MPTSPCYMALFSAIIKLQQLQVVIVVSYILGTVFFPAY